ncbi:hypothetical protein [Mucilaginibacter sp. AK015]|uniref:hypothetical protein n=1 Tax=Mucilaginibacter sp. AK015 TaxID=2723072 RepID=UPI001620046E|nr:hypothetical protein [Mucilaginibacter sp. AK015]MBB5395693.1 hypothetical protein [Mucilaginibacter sp. AK015]
MKNIFLSRPNWVSPNFKAGLDNFLSLLKSHELNPRTIGTTDYPNKSPMDAVIDLLNECEGAIILGYPQINIVSGKIKDHKIDKALELSTEWNHIEAGIAHALGLPLLIIHHDTVSRGIFDLGVLNYFLYKKDFCDGTWGISPEITGALNKWKSVLKPLPKATKSVRQNETPKVKWGCFTFPPDENLYCPKCYNNQNLKMLTTRDGIKNRKCTSCEANISTQ